MNIEQETLTSKEQKKVLFRLLNYVKPHKKQITIAFLLLAFSTLCEAAGPYIIKIFIDDYITPKNIILNEIMILAIMYIVIQLANGGIMYYQSVKFQVIALKIIQQLRVDVFTKIQQLGMSFFDRTPVGSVVSRVTNDTEAIKQMFVSVLAIFLQSIFLFVGIFGAMFLLNAKLAIFLLIILPILYYIIYTYQKLSSSFYTEIRERLSQLNAKMNESLQGMGIIQVFRQEERLKSEFESINSQHYEVGMKKIKIDGILLRPAVDMVAVLAIIMVLNYFGIVSMNKKLEIGVLFAFINYLNRLFEPVNNAMYQLSFFQQAIVSASRVFLILDYDELVPAQIPEVGTSIQECKIEFKDITFSYDNKQDVLKNISFTANPSETVAFVGHTGSGKSTIINLLMRFYEYSQGDILIDDKSIRSYSTEELREKIGLVLQDSFLFYGNIKDNIRMYNDTISDEDIIKAAKFVQAHNFIEKLSHGYDHQVTERGTTFSSGQRQLIAFARAIATNPQILILDEATANIDTETEEHIQQALAKMRKGRTSIVIAHRLSTIQDANLILVLHRGEIVERGTHQELLARRGLYYKMYLLQNGLSEEIQGIIEG